jgi:hypothetical protein
VTVRNTRAARKSTNHRFVVPIAANTASSTPSHARVRFLLGTEQRTALK